MMGKSMKWMEGNMNGCLCLHKEESMCLCVCVIGRALPTFVSSYTHHWYTVPKGKCDPWTYKALSLPPIVFLLSFNFYSKCLLYNLPSIEFHWPEEGGRLKHLLKQAQQRFKHFLSLKLKLCQQSSLLVLICRWGMQKFRETRCQSIRKIRNS